MGSVPARHTFVIIRKNDKGKRRKLRVVEVVESQVIAVRGKSETSWKKVWDADMHQPNAKERDIGL